MTDTTTPLLQSIGIISSAFTAGTIYALSSISGPALLRAPDSLLAQQWQTLYDLGKKRGPLFSILGTSTLGYLAYTAESGRSSMLYSVSAALTVGIVPFTIIFMKATNDALYVRATAGEKDKAGGETRTLVQRWLVLNQVRGLLPLVGAGVAAWAILFNA